MTAVLTGVQCYFTVVLSCISVIMNGIKHLFMCLLVIWSMSLLWLLSDLLLKGLGHQKFAERASRTPLI